jgi:hypothetical protein
MQKVGLGDDLETVISTKQKGKFNICFVTKYKVVKF